MKRHIISFIIIAILTSSLVGCTSASTSSYQPLQNSIVATSTFTYQPSTNTESNTHSYDIYTIWTKPWCETFGSDWIHMSSSLKQDMANATINRVREMGYVCNCESSFVASLIDNFYSVSSNLNVDLATAASSALKAYIKK